MDAFLSKAMIRRELDFDGNDLADGRNGQRGLCSPPRNKNSAATHVFRVHSRLGPKRRGHHMAFQVDLEPRTFAPIYGFHFRASIQQRI